MVWGGVVVWSGTFHLSVGGSLRALSSITRSMFLGLVSLIRMEHMSRKNHKTYIFNCFLNG